MRMDDQLGIQDHGLPLLSVVVAFRMGETSIIDCLDSIYAMDYPHERLDVIVVDDWHDDETFVRINSTFPNTTVLRNTKPQGCDVSKELGILAAAGEIIALTDADCTLHPLWGRTIAKTLCADAGVVTGPVIHPRSFLRELICVADFPLFQSREYHLANSFPGCNFATRRQVLESVGFKYNRTEVRGGSDRLLSWHLYRRGERIVYEPRMVVYHRPAVDWKSILVRRRMYGRTAYMMRKVDPTLPGGIIARVGPLCGLAYICYKSFMDLVRLPKMVRVGAAHPLHALFLIPCLFLFRILDAIGMTTLQLTELLHVAEDSLPIL